MYPVDEVDPHILSAAVYVYRPLVVGYLLGVDADTYALASEDVSAVLDELRILNCLRVYGYLVRTGSQCIAYVIDGLYSAAHCERYEYLFRSVAHYVKEHAASLERSRYIVENQLVRALLVVLSCALNGISDIADSLKINALYDLAVPYIKARDNSFCKHYLPPFSITI